MFNGRFLLSDIGKCASANCPYAITGVLKTHCCFYCRDHNGEKGHGRHCQNLRHIPYDAGSDWLANGQPTPFAQMLPLKRDAFLAAGHLPRTLNAQSVLNSVKSSIVDSSPPAADDERMSGDELIAAQKRVKERMASKRWSHSRTRSNAPGDAHSVGGAHPTAKVDSHPDAHPPAAQPGQPASQPA